MTKRFVLAALVACLVATTVFAAAWVRERSTSRALRSQIETYCRSLASETRTTSNEYARRLEQLNDPKLSAEQRQRAVAKFDQHGTHILPDASRPSRVAAANALYDRFAFCAGTRSAPPRVRDALLTRFNVVSVELWDAEQRSELVAKLGQLAQLAHEMAALPSDH